MLSQARCRFCLTNKPIKTIMDFTLIEVGGLGVKVLPRDISKLETIENTTSYLPSLKLT